MRLAQRNDDLGGVNVIRQYLLARQIDEMHVAIAPIILGDGERLFSGINLQDLGYLCATHAASPNAMHLVLRKRA